MDDPTAAPGTGGTGAQDPTRVVSDDFVSNVEIAVNDDVNTILEVTWNQVVQAEQTWLEFSFETGSVLTSRPSPGTVGAHRDVVLGVPGDTQVAIRVVNEQAGSTFVTQDYSGTTGPIPAAMPVPTVLAYDATRASPDRYLFGAVEDSDGGMLGTYYFRTFWLYIIDRQGRVVWYYADPSTSATSSFQRIARDGEYIWIEKRCFACGNFNETVIKRTLDRSYFEEIDVPGLADCIDVTDDGSLLFNTNNDLMEMTRDGEFRAIFNCPSHFGNGFQCYTNTINWNSADDTVLMSYPEPQTIIQVSRQTGQVVGQYGDAPGSYAFAPPLTSPPAAWNFGFQHFPNITAEGTLMVSSHMPGFENTNMPVANQHAFLEFAIDRNAQTLTEVWRYNLGPEWPQAKGMAISLPNGNVLGNYGTGGVIREITRDTKETVFMVKFDTAGGDDFFNKMVGNNVLIDDLYALNGGGP